jgi:multidrug efflux system membrane fusion protein
MVVPHDAATARTRYIYVVMTATQMRDVTVLYDGGGEVAIKGDVRPGDAVITDGQLRVLPGSPVSIVKPASGAKTSAP